MNLREFTDGVDQNAEEMGKDELKCFIHNIARKIPEDKRMEFLKLLSNIRESGGASGGKSDLQAAAKRIDEQEIKQEFDRLQCLCRQIVEEELCLHADGYEDYSLGYWGDNWVWEYSDPQSVCCTYEDGSILVQRCVNDGFYEYAIDVFDLLMETEVWVVNDGDAFNMDLAELVKEGLVSVNLEKLALHVLYAIYQATAPPMRAQKLFDYFSISYFKDICMEKMLCLGQEELMGLSDFWDSWIMLLAGKTSDVAERLLKEAIIYQKGEDGILDVARIAYQSHPMLYLEAVEHFRKTENIQQQLEIGIEALGKIEKRYIIRSQIALKIAEAAIRRGKTEYAETCWLEAFESNSTPVNYLRLVAESEDFAGQQIAAERIIQSAKVSKNARGVSQELQENFISESNKEILRFLSGDFEVSMNQCCKVDKALGWTGKFVKCGLPLFLLLLLKSEDLEPACENMAEMALRYMSFDMDLYLEGTKYKVKPGEAGKKFQDSKTVFWQCFKSWKGRYCLSDDQKNGYLFKLEKLIDMRLKAILDGNFRAHYQSVAALAAALGEVKESWGELGAKERDLQAYRQMYTRRSSFHAELRRYGMSDTRKNKKKLH